MSWSLEDSRNLYFGLEKDVPESYWKKVSRRGVNVAPAAVEWDPKWSQANCPGLQSTMTELASLVTNERWHQRVSSIFCARVDERDPSGVFHNEKGAFIKVSSSYLDSFIPYAQLYLYLRDASVFPPFVIAGSYRGSIGYLRGIYDPRRRHSLLSAVDLWPLAFSDDQRRREVFGYASDAERWVVAHEIAHEVLRTGSSRFDREAMTFVSSVLGRPELRVELFGLGRSKLNEVRCDILAMEIIAGEFSHDVNEVTLMQAMQGAMLALSSLGDLGYGWINEGDASHPGSLLRMTVVAKWLAVRHRKLYAKASGRSVPWFVFALALADDLSLVSRRLTSAGNGTMYELLMEIFVMTESLRSVGARVPDALWGRRLEGL